MQKIDEEVKHEIIRLLSEGELSQNEIAAEYGVSQGTVSTLNKKMLSDPELTENQIKYYKELECMLNACWPPRLPKKGTRTRKSNFRSPYHPNGMTIKVI